MPPWILDLLPAIASGAVCGLVAWGGIRAELLALSTNVRRAHKRLDMIEAPNWTE